MQQLQNNLNLSRPCIYSYLDYRKFLKDFYQFKKCHLRHYSYAAFSLRAGLKSPNYMKLVMDGGRNLTPANVLKFARALDLDEKETAHWESLVNFTQAKTTEHRKHYFSKLAQSPLPRDQKENVAVRQIRDEWELLSHWYHLAVRELVLLPAFDEDPRKVSRLLNGLITPTQAKESLELLQRLKFLIRDDKTGRLVQEQRTIEYVVNTDVINMAVQKFHKSTGSLALDVLENTAPKERDFSGLTIAIPQEALPTIKAKIRDFRAALDRELSATPCADQVIHINFQLIPLTTPIKGLKP